MKTPSKRYIYPLELTPRIRALVMSAKKTTGVKSGALLMRMAIERGLPLVVDQLNVHRPAN